MSERKTIRLEDDQVDKIERIQADERVSFSEAVRFCIDAYTTVPTSSIDEKISELESSVDALKNEQDDLSDEIGHKQAEIERLKAKKEDDEKDEEWYDGAIEQCAEVVVRSRRDHESYSYTHLSPYSDAVELKGETQVEQDIENKADKLEATPCSK